MMLEKILKVISLEYKNTVKSSVVKWWKIVVKIFISLILFAHNKNENRSINKQLRRNFPIVSAIVVISTTGWDFQWKLVTSKCVWSFLQYAVQYLVEDHFIYWMRHSCQAGPGTGLYYVTAAISDDEEHSWNRMIQPICGGALHQSSHTSSHPVKLLGQNHLG